MDKIACGDGNDVALLDAVDVITDATAQNPNGSCEKVVRKASRSRDDRDEIANDRPASPHGRPQGGSPPGSLTGSAGRLLAGHH